MIRELVLTSLKFYKKYLTPMLVVVFGHSCRFNPTCGEYAYVVVEKYGILKGAKMTAGRLLRCNPFYKVKLTENLSEVPN